MSYLQHGESGRESGTGRGSRCKSPMEESRGSSEELQGDQWGCGGTREVKFLLGSGVVIQHFTSSNIKFELSSKFSGMPLRAFKQD